MLLLAQIDDELINKSLDVWLWYGCGEERGKCEQASDVAHDIVLQCLLLEVLACKLVLNRVTVVDIFFAQKLEVLFFQALKPF